MSTTIRIFTVVALLLAVGLAPVSVWASTPATVAFDDVPGTGAQGGGVTITLTNLENGRSFTGTTNTRGEVIFPDVPPGYYRVQIQMGAKLYIDYVWSGSLRKSLRYGWSDVEDASGWFLLGSLATTITEFRGAAIGATRNNDKKALTDSIQALQDLQSMHELALRKLEKLDLPGAVQQSMRNAHKDAIDKVTTALGEIVKAAESRPSAQGREQQRGTGNNKSAGDRKAALEEKQSQLQQQRQSQTARIANFTPSFLDRRQYLLEKLPPTLQANLTRGGNTDTAGFAAVNRTRLQIQIEMQEAANKGTTASADLVRLKTLYERMAGYYSALFDTESKIAQVQKLIAHTIVDEKDYATGGGDGGGGGEGGGGGN